jgi:hypothetical protein
MSTSAVDTWRVVKIWTENLTEVPNGFLLLIQVSLMIQNKTEVLNLKTHLNWHKLQYTTKLSNLMTCVLYINRDRDRARSVQFRIYLKTARLVHLDRTVYVLT